MCIEFTFILEENFFIYESIVLHRKNFNSEKYDLILLLDKVLTKKKIVKNGLIKCIIFIFKKCIKYVR